jgi:stage II sporulation protein D
MLGWDPEMRRFAVPTALLACLAMPVGASASTIFVVKGHGFGHGIGMSQYGAQGFAQHGWDYRRILAHYYRGTTIGSAPTKTIRVLLRSGAGSLTVSHVSRAGTRKLNPAVAYTVRARGSGVTISGGGKTRRFSGPVRLRGPRGYTVLGGAYRGAMEVRPSISSRGVTAIDVLSLDNYVRGVVPGEMPPIWLAEALKVQAVAARSYALATDAGGPLFDQYADTRSQAYHGMSAEQPSTNAAVRGTAGQVVLSGGTIATTYYFSTSGGRTENVENVFYGAAPTPYLKSVKDPYDGASPRHAWQLRFTRSQIQARLGSLCTGSFKGIKVVKRGVSPRVVSADVVCLRSRVRTTGATLRARLGLYDTWFTVTRATSSAARPRSGAAPSVPLITPLLHPRTISGSFVPRLPSVSVERLDRGRWTLVARGLTNRLGQYFVPVYQAGTYRVSGGGVSAQPVSVR